MNRYYVPALQAKFGLSSCVIIDHRGDGGDMIINVKPFENVNAAPGFGAFKDSQVEGWPG